MIYSLVKIFFLKEQDVSEFCGSVGNSVREDIEENNILIASQERKRYQPLSSAP